MLFLKILLCILKIIGIVLLVVVGIVLLILCLLLFVPIRYRVHASFYGKPRVSAHVTYLLRLLHVNFELDGKESELKIKLFGHNISDGKKTDDKKTADSPGQNDSTVKEEHDAVKAGEAVKSCEVDTPTKSKKAIESEASSDIRSGRNQEAHMLENPGKQISQITPESRKASMIRNLTKKLKSPVLIQTESSIRSSQ